MSELVQMFTTRPVERQPLSVVDMKEIAKASRREIDMDAIDEAIRFSGARDPRLSAGDLERLRTELNYMHGLGFLETTPDGTYRPSEFTQRLIDACALAKGCHLLDDR